MDDNNQIPEDEVQNPIPPSATSPPGDELHTPIPPSGTSLPEDDARFPEDEEFSTGENGDAEDADADGATDSEHTRKVGQTRHRSPVVNRRVIWHEKTYHRRNHLITAIIRILQIIGTLVLIGALTGSLFACYVLSYIRDDILPKAKVDLGVYTMNENSIIYYYDKDTGQPVQMQTLMASENREYVPYDDIPENLINAVVAIEDKRFWDHQGVDWYRTMGAFVNMFLSMRNTFGASTLTQQTIKNFTEYDDVTVTRKILEIFTAIQAERDYTKEYILERYLNKIYLGNGCYGVQAAAKYYFGKDVWDLDLSECASIAGITNNPSLYSPYGMVHVTRYKCNECGTMNNDPEEPCVGCGEIDYGPGEEWTNREYNLRRRDLILLEMYQPSNDTEPTIFDQIRDAIFGQDHLEPYITKEEYEQAINEKLILTADDDYVAPDEDLDMVDNPNAGVKYNWYEEAVITEAIDLLKGVNGMDEDYNTQLVFSGGLKIYCAYDPFIQSCIDQIYNDPESLPLSSALSGQKAQSNITIVDNSTGMVVAMGTTFPKLVDRGWNYPVDTVRQPGSSIKPLSVYGPALELGLITPASISDDNPHYVGSPGNQFLPTNAPLGYNGLMTIMDGVKVSKNTISINTLEMVTPQVSFQFMTQRFHFTSLVDYYETSYGQVLSDIQISPLAMGGLTYGVSTHEMAAAFATFPRGGSYRAASTIYRIEDINGRVLVDNTNNTQYILKESTAYYMNTMLTNVVAGTGGATGTAAQIPGQTVAGKTGTTNNKWDLWFCGYTNYYTGAVWVGYDNSEEIVYTGAAPATVLWQKVMALVHEGLTNAHFSTPGNLRDVQICLDCGKLATENCQLDMRGNRIQTFRLVNGDAPTEYCNCHVLIDVCLDSPISGSTAYHLAGPNCPAESVRRIAMVDRPREIVNGVYVADWDRFLSIYDRFSEDEKYCQVHTAPEPEPSDDPEPSESPSDEPGESRDPSAEPTNPPPAESLPGDPEPSPTE